MRFTSRGKKDTMATTAMLVLMPRPKNSIMMGATAATGVDRNAITTGSEAWARFRLSENATAIVVANSVLMTSPSAAAVSVKVVWLPMTCQLAAIERMTEIGSGTMLGGMRSPTT